jgi:hypothetical protein
MNIKRLQNIPKILKKWYFVLRSDPEAMEQFRLLALGLAACFTIYYGGTSLFIEPQEKNLDQKIAQKQMLASSVPREYQTDMLPLLKQLVAKKASMQEQIEILKLQKEMLLEQWELLGDARRFANIIFTLQPSASVNIEDSLEQMTVADKRSHDTYDLYPVTLAGSSDFENLLEYLQYIEKHSEVGLLDNLVMEIAPGHNEREKAKIHFSLMVGRINLKQVI